MKCTHITVFGKVQGVFFRDSTRRKATALGLKGYAENLADGNVEVVAEGSEEKIKELISFIKQGPGVSRVTGVQIKHREPENFKSFEIRH
ncbi:acylphosphatase [Candidatus Woesearchaeota archaeon]|nr:acylphosphatase [Candidatus Woesearchaeota archaeon]